MKKQNNELDIGSKSENGVSRGDVNIKGPELVIVWRQHGLEACDYLTDIHVPYTPKSVMCFSRLEDPSFSVIDLLLTNTFFQTMW